MKQVITIQHTAIKWQCKIEVEPTFKLPNTTATMRTTGELIQQISFRYTSEDDSTAKNEYMSTFVKALGRELFYLTCQAHGRIYIEDAIEWFRFRKDWFPMDGTHGVSIKEVGETDIRLKDFISSFQTLEA